MAKEKAIRLIWQCDHCKSYNVSYSNLHHRMDGCDCGKSAIDIEEFYQRNMGEIIELSRKQCVDGEWKDVE